jgi:hypothetical protein
MTENLNIEVYEYKLQNYPFTLNNSYPFYSSELEIKSEQLNSSEESDCSIITTSSSDTVKNEFYTHISPITNSKITTNIDLLTKDIMVRSCDPINGKLKIARFDEEVPFSPINMPKDIEFNINGIDSNDLIIFSNQNGAKKLIKNTFNYDNVGSINNFYDLKYVVIIFIKLFKILKEDWIDNENSSLSKDDDKTFLENTLIKILRPDKNQKYIIFGDFHGSFHTFLRHLIRFRILGIMDSKCKLLNNHHLIFLGDLIDRGNYGYEILILIFLLKIKNPENVHINRGNHEEVGINTNEGFKLEIETKFKTKEAIDTIYNSINNLFNYLHSAILIKNPINGKYAYLAHGGLPLETHSNSLIDKFTNFPDSFRMHKTNNIILKNSLISYVDINTIRWSDFNGLNDFFIEPSTARPNIGTHILDMTDNFLEIIIRGHQDSSFNTKLIKRNENVFTNINSLPAFNQEVVNNDVECYKFTHLIKVIENEIIVNNNVRNPFIKVLTISNNTDLKRDLDRDSYVILKYIEEFELNYDSCILKGTDDEKTIKFNKITRAINNIISIEDIRLIKEINEMYNVKIEDIKLLNKVKKVYKLYSKLQIINKVFAKKWIYKNYKPLRDFIYYTTKYKLPIDDSPEIPKMKFDKYRDFLENIGIIVDDEYHPRIESLKFIKLRIKNLDQLNFDYSKDRVFVPEEILSLLYETNKELEEGEVIDIFKKKYLKYKLKYLELKSKI